MVKQLFGFSALVLFVLVGTSCALLPKKNKPDLMPPHRTLSEKEVKELHAHVAAFQYHLDHKRYKDAEQVLSAIRLEYPQMLALDLAPLLEAEDYLTRNKWLKSAKVYEGLLEDYPDSPLKDPALKRLYKIGTAYLNGRKKSVLGVFSLRGYSEGAAILEVVTDEVGLEDPNGMGVRAARAVAQSHEKREQHEEAYLKWLEISTVWQSGDLGQQALLGMARNKRAVYNSHPPERRALFDGTSLKTSRSYYDKFSVLFPEEAGELGIAEVIAEIDEQIAHKELSIGQYYRRTGKEQAANIYFDMIITNWPDTEAAQEARTRVPTDDSY
ncbi:MAG: outer membrane protein assembly factor BamD [Planctomycetes bacterium]|nr:outer membrane protein assembly factor BamD [Planctomycetota bacterium]